MLKELLEQEQRKIDSIYAKCIEAFNEVKEQDEILRQLKHNGSINKYVYKKFANERKVYEKKVLEYNKELIASSITIKKIKAQQEQATRSKINEKLENVEKHINDIKIEKQRQEDKKNECLNRNSIYEKMNKILQDANIGYFEMKDFNNKPFQDNIDNIEKKAAYEIKIIEVLMLSLPKDQQEKYKAKVDALRYAMREMDTTGKHSDTYEIYQSDYVKKDKNGNFVSGIPALVHQAREQTKKSVNPQDLFR